MQYFISKDSCFPENAKTSTNSICYAILEKDAPDVLVNLTEVDGDFLPYRAMVEQTDTPDKPILMFVREPIDRFVSAVSMNGGLIPVDEHIASVEAGEDNHLFHKQSDYIIKGKTTLFKFPTQIKDFCKAAGFQYPIPKLNQVQNPKVELTDEQLAWAKNYYADDIKLFNSLKG